MQNRLKEFRSRKGFSQQRLADLVGTSQQQIQRIEAGSLKARLDMAVMLAAVLEQPFNKLFPGVDKSVKAVQKEARAGFLPSDATFEKLSSAGVELDLRTWYFKFLLRGHSREFVHEVPGSEKRRMFHTVQQEGGSNSEMAFLVYDTSEERVAVNLSQMAYCHFLFEPMGIINRKKEDLQPEISVYFCGSQKRFGFRVEPDSELGPESEEMAEFDGIFYDLESAPEQTDRIYFEDEDGEDVFIRAGDLAMLQVPLFIVEPQLIYEKDEEDEESEGH